MTAAREHRVKNSKLFSTPKGLRSATPLAVVASSAGSMCVFVHLQEQSAQTPQRTPHRAVARSVHSSLRSHNVGSQNNFMTAGILAAAGAMSTALAASQRPRAIVRQRAQKPSSELLIAEEHISDDISASLLADRCMEEGRRLLTGSGWKQEFEEDEVQVESKPVSGAYEVSGVHLVRGRGVVEASCDSVWKFLSSREGFETIDEFAVNHSNLESYSWLTRDDLKANDYKLMMNCVEWPYPGKKRDFVALDIINHKERILVSKSALHASRPGGSRYSQQESAGHGQDVVRAVQYAAITVEPLTSRTCMLTMVFWGDTCDDFNPHWINKFNTYVFIKPKWDRISSAMKGEPVWRSLSNIVSVAWKLPQLLAARPDTIPTQWKGGFSAGTDRGETHALAYSQV